MILGGGGHARSLLEAFHCKLPIYPVAVLDNNRFLWKQHIVGIPVVGGDSCMPHLLAAGVKHFVIGLGATGNNHSRHRLFKTAAEHGLQPASVIHQSAGISPSAQISPGAQLMAGTLIGACSAIGENTVINTGAIIEHDCRIAAHAHIATGARLCGGVTVGAGAHIGAGATIVQGITIGAWAIVGAGAVVIRDVKPRTVVTGVPAKFLRRTSVPAALRHKS